MMWLCFQFEIALTRYNGGSKGPVVMFHGAGVSSGMFSLDTIDTNLVEYLVQHRYDVTFAAVSCNNPLEISPLDSKTRTTTRSRFSQYLVVRVPEPASR